jgi:hypothetical protein
MAHQVVDDQPLVGERRPRAQHVGVGQLPQATLKRSAVQARGVAARRGIVAQQHELTLIGAHSAVGDAQVLLQLDREGGAGTDPRDEQRSAGTAAPAACKVAFQIVTTRGGGWLPFASLTHAAGGESNDHAASKPERRGLARVEFGLAIR